VTSPSAEAIRRAERFNPTHAWSSIWARYTGISRFIAGGIPLAVQYANKRYRDSLGTVLPASFPLDLAKSAEGVGADVHRRMRG
jgi:hypothetical protein